MGAPKYKPSELQKLYAEDSNQNLHDKQIIEALKKRLNEKLQNNPELSKKAALILESWLRKK